MDQTNERTDEESDTFSNNTEIGTIPSEASSSNHCAVNLFGEAKDNTSSEGLETAENNHCAVTLKGDSNNCDTNALGSFVCHIDNECNDNQDCSDITTSLQQNDSAVVYSPASEGSVMDTSCGLENQTDAEFFENTGVGNLAVDDSGICVEKEDPVLREKSPASSSVLKCLPKIGETEMLCGAEVNNSEKQSKKMFSDLHPREEIFIDSNKDILQDTIRGKDISRESDSDQDVQFKDCERNPPSVLDSPKSNEKCQMDTSCKSGPELVSGFSSDSDEGGDHTGKAAGNTVKKKIKPLVDYDDSDDNTSGPTSYNVTDGKWPSGKSDASSNSSSDSDGDEMDALDMFLARRKRRMDSEDRSSQGSEAHEEGEEDSRETTSNRNMEDSSTHADSDADDEDEDLDIGTPPKDPWSPLIQVRARELGVNNRAYGAQKFRVQCGASVKFVQRFRRQSKLEKHEGCVNALHFNQSGTSLASGSDDLNIVVWDWVHEKPFFTFDSGHRSNVFQCKFMPFTGDSHLVSCARDGQVRLAELSSTGKCKNTKKLAQHKGAAHKLALLDDSSHVFYSCGEDAVVYEIDLRQEKPNKLCTTSEKQRKVPLYSIHSNPFKSHEYCVGGRDHFLRVYDKRKISGDGSGDADTVKKYCPHHLIDSDIKANVTCAVYNWNGMEVLGTYNDEDIYLFDNTHSDGAEHTGRYRGHRNNATVKGVNFYGPRSEFVVSGSDCGHVFLWDKQSHNILNFIKGDEAGVVNVLEPHPHMPVLATSGLDHDVKIWSPLAPEPTKLEGLKKLVKKNRKERTEERSSDPDMYDGHMLWFLMHHLRRARRMRGAEGGGSSTDSDDVERGESENSEDEDPMQCVPS